MSIQVGERLPSVTLTQMGPEKPVQVTTDEVFKGKRAVLFAVPGAFTPTCSAQHLPGFVQLAEQIKAKGIDLIACTAVNDIYVMEAWSESQKARNSVLMLADGSATFASAIGLERDMIDRGFGIRSKRYAMVLEDQIIKILNVEGPGQFEGSKAETILSLL